MQLIHAMPLIWKQRINESRKNAETNENFNWKKIYILPRVATASSFQPNFQYKILHNILYLNKMLFTFGKTKKTSVLKLLSIYF